MPEPEGGARVYLEIGKRRTFAAALDWPGWARAGRSPDDALTMLSAYAPRYAQVARWAGLEFGPEEGETLRVVERLIGNATTDFGAPDVPACADAEPVGGHEAHRIGALVHAAWTFFDRIAAASPAELRKGPRGGGRNRDAMIAHVLGAEAGYARKIGVRHREPAIGDREAISRLRHDLLAVLAAESDGRPVGEKGWPTRYAARRIAWHVLDHAWEMADRRDPVR